MNAPAEASDAESTSGAAAPATLSARLDDDVCSLTGTIDFDTAPGCLDTVASYIDNHASLVIDLAGVTRSNSAGLALMVEWLAVARKQGHEVTFRAVPDGLQQLAGVCQVDSLF